MRSRTGNTFDFIIVNTVDASQNVVAVPAMGLERAKFNVPKVKFLSALF